MKEGPTEHLSTRRGKSFSGGHTLKRFHNGNKMETQETANPVSRSKKKTNCWNISEL